MKRLLARLYLWMTRWRFEGEVPVAPRYVLIAAPHTSNWDLVHMLALGWWLGLQVKWMGKHTLFKFPFGWFMRWLGGLAIDRTARSQVVDQAAARLREAARMILVVPPEGTRGKRDFWKSGFYFIARAADVPVVLGFLDYSRKVGGLGPCLTLSGDVRADMDKLRAFYRPEMARVPARFTVPRLSAEDA